MASMLPKKRKLDNESPFDKLSSDITGNILSRLPTKTLLKCLSVQTQWYNIIRSPEFSVERCSRCSSISLLIQGMFYEEKGMEFALLEIEKSSTVDAYGNILVGYDSLLKLRPITKYRIDELRILNASHGLICLRVVGLWSPVVINVLSATNPSFHQPLVEYGVRGMAFGFSNRADAYKIIRVRELHGKFMAEVFTIGRDGWRFLGESPVRQFSRASLDVRLFSCAVNKDIFCFNFDDEAFEIVPISSEMEKVQIKGLHIFQGMLCCSIADELSVRFWLRKAINESYIWEQSFNIIGNLGNEAIIPIYQLDDGSLLAAKVCANFADSRHRLALLQIQDKRICEVKFRGRRIVDCLDLQVNMAAGKAGRIQGEGKSSNKVQESL